MYRWLPGLKPTTLLDLCTPKTIHKLTPWREVRESDSRLQFCRLAYEPLYELPICIGPGGGTQTLVAGATILHFNPLNYSWDIWWARLDSNQRSVKRRVYSAMVLPLTDSPICMAQHTGFEPATPSGNGFQDRVLTTRTCCIYYGVEGGIRTLAPEYLT